MTDTPLSDHDLLEDFVVDNEDLRKLEQRLAGFNLFEALGHVHREERHSDFLAWLLDPSAEHGLDAAVLRAFVHEVLADEPEEPCALRPLNIALFDFDKVRVEREWNAIDVLVISESEDDRFVMLIENKIDSDEHSNQLTRYLERIRGRFGEGWRILPVFLTRDGHRASHPAYYSVSHAQVRRIAKDLLKRQRSTLTPDVEVALRHYTEMLERHIMDNSPIAQLARKIYSQHKRALDLIFEHRPDDQEAIRDELVRLIEAEDTLRLIYASKSYIHFVPRSWDEVEALRSGGDGSWVSRPELLRFEWEQSQWLSLHLRIGPGDDDLRQRIFERAQAELSDHFKHRSGQLYAKWTQLWRRAAFSKKLGPKLTLDEKLEKAGALWGSFTKDALPDLERAVLEMFEDPAAR